MRQNVFDLPNNPYVQALTRIERYVYVKNEYCDHSINIVKDFKRFKDQAVAFLVAEELMNPDGSLTESFTTDHPNPLISDAAFHAQAVFAG